MKKKRERVGLQKRCRPRERAEKIAHCWNCRGGKLYHRIEGQWWCTGCYMNDRPTGKKTRKDVPIKRIRMGM